jgi:hypothetical protein
VDYFSKIYNDEIVLFASEVISSEDEIYSCKAPYGVVQFNSKLHPQTVKSADDREWVLRSDFETEVETVVQGMEFTLEPYKS